MFNETLIDNLYKEIFNEFLRASKNYPMFSNEYEGYAIILEELDELWEVVKLKQSNPERLVKCRKECIQVAAMALRFLHDMETRKRGIYYEG